MKRTSIVIALCGYLCCVATLPATTPPPEIGHDVEFVAPKESNGDQPIIDTGFGFDGPFSNPFNDFVDGFQNFMSKIRRQMESVLNQFPIIRAGNSSDEIPDFSSVEGFGFPQFGDIDLGKGNTTSETKIIDGHKVIINQTEYHKDTPNGSSFFKVRVIDVKPTDANSEEVTQPTIAPPKDREALENSVENEIQKNNEAIFYQPLEHDHSLETASQLRQPNFIYRIDNSEWNDLNQVEQIPDNSLSFEGGSPVVDLSRDTYVNELLAKNGAPVNPDAEIIEIVPQRSSGGTPFLYGFQNRR